VAVAGLVGAAMVMRNITSARSAMTLASAGSKPRSRNTLPLLLMRRVSERRGSVFLLMTFLQSFLVGRGQIDVHPRRLVRLLLERMQHVDSGLELGHVDRRATFEKRADNDESACFRRCGGDSTPEW
jgi:hypothetical protein